MTDVVKLINSDSPIHNGSSIVGVNSIIEYQDLIDMVIVPVINNQTYVSGVAGATDNGYLDNRFRAS